MEFVILDTGDAARFAGKLDESAINAENFEAPIKLIKADILKIERAVFSSGGRRGGGSWKGLADSTIKKKGSVQILRETDALYDSMTQPGAAWQILEVTPTTMVFGTNRPWAAVHQYGNSHTPARPFLRILPIDVNRWARMLLTHLTEMFRTE